MSLSIIFDSQGLSRHDDHQLNVWRDRGGGIRYAGAVLSSGSHQRTSSKSMGTDEKLERARLPFGEKKPIITRSSVGRAMSFGPTLSTACSMGIQPLAA